MKQQKNLQLSGTLTQPLFVRENDHNRLINRELSDQHPISAITGLADKLSKIPTDEDKDRWNVGAGILTYTQKIPSNKWRIKHDLGKFPSITIVDSSGAIVFGETRYIDTNSVELEFSSEFSGSAYLR